MMKWRRRRSSSFDFTDSKGSQNSLVSNSSSEQSLDDGDPFSPYEDLHLEDLYKKFRSKTHSDSSLAELENSLELYQNMNSPTSTPKRQYIRQKSNEKTRSQVFLPSIDEHDELLSIADSGISCDADDEYDIDESLIGNKKRSYFLPLKGSDELEFELQQEDTNSSLLSCISEELFKRSNSETGELVVKNLQKANITLKPTEHQENNMDNKRKLHRQHGVVTESIDSFEILEAAEKTESFSTIRSPTDDRILSDVDPDNLLHSPSTENILSDNNVLSEIDATNSQIFHRLKLKAELDQPLHTGERPDTLPYSLMSSLIWGGETSRHSPSPVEIYPTMPPNRYLSDPLNDIISRDEQDSGNNFDFVVHLNVSQYGPDEILVTLEDGKVVVNGKHFSESDYGFESCQFHRQYPIPEGIKKTDIRSKISEEGILTITAKRTESRTRNAKQARRGSKDLELLLLPARSLSSSNDERPATPVLKSPNSKLPPSPSNIKSDGEFTELNMNTYQLRVQCNGYKPEDLDVRVSGMELLVSGRQKINTGDKQIKHKEFTKAFAIPQNADPNSITSRFLQNTLNIEVSKTIRRTSSGNILNNY